MPFNREDEMLAGNILILHSCMLFLYIYSLKHTQYFSSFKLYLLFCILMYLLLQSPEVGQSSLKRTENTDVLFRIKHEKRIRKYILIFLTCVLMTVKKRKSG